MAALKAEWHELIESLKDRTTRDPEAFLCVTRLEDLLGSLGSCRDRPFLDANEPQQIVSTVIEPLISMLSDSPQLLQEIILIVGKVYRLMGAYDNARDWYERLLGQPSTPISIEMQADVAKQLGHLKALECRWDEAEEHYAHSRTLFMSSGNMADVADVHNNLGYNELQRGNLKAAGELHQQAIESVRLAEAPLVHADAHNSLAVIASIQGRWDAAIDHFQASLDAYEEAGNPEGLAQTYLNLAMAYVDSGELEAAGECYNTATELAQKAGDREVLAAIYVNRAEFLLNFSTIDAAQMYCSLAFRIFQQMNDPIGKAEAHKLMGRIARHRNAWEEAQGHFQQSLQWYEESQNPQGQAEAHYEFGKVYLDQGIFPQAEERLQQSKSLFQQLEAHESIAQVDEALAMCA